MAILCAGLRTDQIPAESLLDLLADLTGFRG